MGNGFVSKICIAAIAVLAVSVHAKQFDAVPGEYIVRLKANSAVQNTLFVSQALGVSVKETVSNDLGIVLVQKPIIENASSVLATLSANPAVAYVEPNYIYRVIGASDAPPTDTEFGRLWGLNNTGQTTAGDAGNVTGVAGNDINALNAWKIETGSKDVVVAVIDTGVDHLHMDLSNNIFTNQAELNGQAGVDDDANGFIDDVHGYDFVQNDADAMDVFGHGTHVSGTIGAQANNGTGVVGVAWNVSILPIRFLDDNGGGTLANAIKSIDYAILMKANIMNNSWGGGGFSQALFDVIAKARDANILFLAAAGNNSDDNDTIDFFPACYKVENVLSVAAIGPSGTLAGFSNYGKTTVHVAAPGVNILSYTMNGMEAWSGTSMATPHVAGIAALLLSHENTLTYMDLKNRIMNSAQPRTALADKVITGGIASAHYALLNEKAPTEVRSPASH